MADHILLSYKGFIQVLSIPLSFGARKVPIKGLNDSVYIISVVCITSVSLAVIIACFAIYCMNNQRRVNTLAAVYSIGFWISATIILLLVFVPKVMVYAVNVLPSPVACHRCTIYYTVISTISSISCKCTTCIVIQMKMNLLPMNIANNITFPLWRSKLRNWK